MTFTTKIPYVTYKGCPFLNLLYKGCPFSGEGSQQHIFSALRPYRRSHSVYSKVRRKKNTPIKGRSSYTTSFISPNFSARFLWPVCLGRRGNFVFLEVAPLGPFLWTSFRNGRNVNLTHNFSY